MIGIRILRVEPPKEFDAPLTGSAAGAYGAGAAVRGLGPPRGPLEAVLWLGVAPVAGIVGAVTSRSQASSEEEVRNATEALKTALAEANPYLRALDALTQRLKQEGVKKIKPLPSNLGQLSENELAKQDLDAVLEIEISWVDLAVFGRIDPDASIVLNAQISVKIPGSEEVHPPYSWAYHSKRQNYFKLAANHAALLRQEIAAAYKNLAGFIVTDLSPAKTPIPAN